MSAYLQLKLWPDVAAVLETLLKRGLRLALLSNMTTAMMQACVKGSNLEALFEFQLSTDRVKAFKPDSAAYSMATEALPFREASDSLRGIRRLGRRRREGIRLPNLWVNRLDVPPRRTRSICRWNRS